MHTIRLVRRNEPRAIAVDLSPMQIAQLFLAGVLVAALLLSGCASSSNNGSSSASQVSVTYEKSEGQATAVETATEPEEIVEIAELDEAGVSELDEEQIQADLETEESVEAEYSDPAARKNRVVIAHKKTCGRKE